MPIIRTEKHILIRSGCSEGSGEIDRRWPFELLTPEDAGFVVRRWWVRQVGVLSQRGGSLGLRGALLCWAKSLASSRVERERAMGLP